MSQNAGILGNYPFEMCYTETYAFWLIPLKSDLDEKIFTTGRSFPIFPCLVAGFIPKNTSSIRKFIISRLFQTLGKKK